MILFETALVLTALLMGFVVLVFWGSMVAHCSRNAELTRESRILWLVALVFGKLLAAGAYYFVKIRSKRLAA